MMNNNSFMQVWNENASLLQEYLEVGIDSIMDDETLKQVPVVNTIMGVFKLGRTISDRYFIKKLLYFLYNIQDISEDEKRVFENKYMKDDKNFAEKLIFIIDKIDDTDKCKYLASIFKCYVRGLIDYTQFRRYVRSINVLGIDEIGYFKDHIDDDRLDIIWGVGLLNAGLAKIDIYMDGKGSYSASEEGIKLFKCILG